MKKQLILLPSLIAAAVAGAQNAPAEDDKTLQEVVVTGSRIVQSAINSQQPISIIDRASIERTGLASIGDLLQQVTAGGKALNAKFNSSGNFGYPADGGGIGAGSAQVDLRNLSSGLSHLVTALLAGGAQVVHPSVQGLPAIRTAREAAVWLDQPLPRAGLGLVTVHAFSSCPMGERRDRCAADSFGRVHGFGNLHLNDASMLPDSPGVNPQGTVMAFARRNVLAFLNGRGAQRPAESNDPAGNT